MSRELLDIFDLAASSEMTQALLNWHPSHPYASLPSFIRTSTPALDSYVDGRDAFDVLEIAGCHFVSSAAACPAPVTLLAPARSGTHPKLALRRSPASSPAPTAASSLADGMHPPADYALDSGGTRSFLGVLYHSYALWELASLMSAIAWLLVCLAA